MSASIETKRKLFSKWVRGGWGSALLILVVFFVMFNLPGYATHLYKVHFTSFYFNTLAENNTKVVQLEINGISHSELAATGEKFWEARSDVDFVGVSSTTIMPTGYARNLLYACGEGLSPDEIERFGQHVSEKSGVNISSTRRMGF